MFLKAQDVIEVNIIGLGVAGEGVGDYKGFKVFVPGALPQEQVQVRLLQVKSTYAKGELIEVKRSSPHRIDPICPLFHRCGGCQIMHLAYEQQLEVKRQRIFDALTRIGKQSDIQVPKVIPSPRQLHYRNKIQLPVSLGDEGIKIGLYERGSHKVVDVDTCWIHNTMGDQVFKEVAALIKGSTLTIYDEKTHQGELRHVLIRSSDKKQEVLVVLVTSKECSQEIRHLANNIFQIKGVRGVVHHKNAREDNVILDRSFTTLHGDPFIEDVVCGLTFKISAASFFQVNPLQAENLYNQAIEYAGLGPESHVLDAYCGIGTLSLLLAQHAQHVVGVECVPQAILDAKENAHRNGLHHVEFICDQTEHAISSLKSFDVVILNPPRQGCAPRLIEELCKRPFKKIVYVSCDPATLARDIFLLSAQGFKCNRIQGFDMFPQTMHVETVVELIR